jgi:hypothetical protein
VNLEPNLQDPRREEAVVPQRLSHVYWLGGSPCSGKSSISEILAAQFDLAVYHVDEAFERHTEQFDPNKHPAMCNWLSMDWEARWMRPIEALLAEAIDAYSEHFSLVLADLLATGDRPVLVEGTALLPDLVRPWLTAVQRAAWVVPAPAFQREHYSRRSFIRAILAECSEPETAFDHWMGRDIQFGRWVLARTNTLGLPSLVVDGSRDLASNAVRLAKIFALGA